MIGIVARELGALVHEDEYPADVLKEAVVRLVRLSLHPITVASLAQQIRAEKAGHPTGWGVGQKDRGLSVEEILELGAKL